MTFSIKTFSKMVLMSISLSLMLNVIYAECRYAECHCDECHYIECRYAECRSALYKVIT